MKQEISFNTSLSGRTFEGIGGVTSNGMTRLLWDYPPLQQEEIISLLFKPNFGASLHVLKVEIGSDANGTAGTEPSHMRSADDFDITRGVGLWLAKQAKRHNADLLLDAIRWGTPSWITNNQEKYLYYKNFLDGAKKVFGLEFDYLAPDENEGDFSRKWVVEVLRPGLDKDGYKDVKLSAADSTESWNIAPIVCGDEKLKNSIYAISAHYHQTTPDCAKTCGLPIFNSEDLAPFRNKFSNALDMAHKIMQSFICGKMVQYQMHPVIEAIYDTTPYSCKSILTAAHPQTGHYTVEAGIWVTAQFTQFIQPGWQLLDDASKCTETVSCLTTKNPLTGDISIIMLNRGDKQADFEIFAQGFHFGKLHLFTTDEIEQFCKKKDILLKDEKFRITVSPRSICTITSTTGQEKGEYNNVPQNKAFTLPYCDSFDRYNVGKQPKYAVDQSGAFEIHYSELSDSKCLKQIITNKTKPINWERRKTPDPYTLLLGQELNNYEASIDVCMLPVSEKDYEGYAMLGIRCNLAPLGDTVPESYNLCIFHNSQWQLRVGQYVLLSGLLDCALERCWHNIKLAANNDEICAYIDNNLIAKVYDDKISSGQVVIGSGYNEVLYKNLTVKAHECAKHYDCTRYYGNNIKLCYNGEWEESGCNSDNYFRTLLTSRKAGCTVEFSFHGTAVNIIGKLDKNCGKIKIELDEKVSEHDTYFECGLPRKCLFSAYDLPLETHKLRLTVLGTRNMNSSDVCVNFSAVEISGGEGLL